MQPTPDFQCWARRRGQKISYEIGKRQILAMLEAARQKEGDQFSLRKFHDYLWLIGNVPIALQQWEYLGRDDEVKKFRPFQKASPAANRN